ncbi:MAG: 16S rRNA (guanine(1207)-N(2))-methyltransferase RsmC [Candidatus Pelagadaptatus aseana]|uniref:methyltransferase n=1 Tax=Candidatus Pelagadaptatus aseana TaxID=3120508 RepID=UPI0039B2C5DB
MTDCSFQLLLPYLQNRGESTLLIADENLLASISSLANNPDLQVISNRFDVIQACNSNGINGFFSDFDFSPLQDHPPTTIAYRISKERPVVHHVINQAFRILEPGGRLILSGEKGDGIKNTVKAAAKLFGAATTAIKNGNSYFAEIHKQMESPVSKWLDDKDYNNLREIGQLQDKPVLSKPGTFGWNKFDKGSEFLIEQASCYLNTKQLSNVSLLDLGCGYGYITLKTAHWDFVTERFATDNNAVALLCLNNNAEHWGIDLNLSAGDCASHIDKTFDLILCNPPFHQGFDTDSSLTRKFLSQTHRLLKPDGEALFVVNQFIPLEKLAKDQFRGIDILGDNGSFKVIALRKRAD